MTGNLALTGLALADCDAALLTHTAVGLTSYALGVAAGTWITGRHGSHGAVWPRSPRARSDQAAVAALTRPSAGRPARVRC